MIDIVLVDYKGRKAGLGVEKTLSMIEKVFSISYIADLEKSTAARNWSIQYNDSSIRITFDDEKNYNEWCMVLAEKYRTKIDTVKGPTELYHIIMACWLGHFWWDDVKEEVCFDAKQTTEELGVLINYLDLYGIVSVPPIEF